MKQFFLARQYPCDQPSFVCANLLFQVLTTLRAIPCTVDSSARAPFDSTTCLRLQPQPENTADSTPPPNVYFSTYIAPAVLRLAPAAQVSSIYVGNSHA